MGQCQASASPISWGSLRDTLLTCHCQGCGTETGSHSLGHGEESQPDWLKKEPRGKMKGTGDEDSWVPGVAGCHTPGIGMCFKDGHHCHGSFLFILSALLQTGTGPITGAVESENCVASHNSGERESQERRHHFWQVDPLEMICSHALCRQLKPKAAGSTWSGPVRPAALQTCPLTPLAPKQSSAASLSWRLLLGGETQASVQGTSQKRGETLGSNVGCTSQEQWKLRRGRWGSSFVRRG